MTAGPGTDRPDEPSAEELRDRFDELGAEHEHGEGEGKPDPTTGENSPEEVGTQKEGFADTNAADPVVPPLEERS